VRSGSGEGDSKRRCLNLLVTADGLRGVTQSRRTCEELGRTRRWQTSEGAADSRESSRSLRRSNTLWGILRLSLRAGETSPWEDGPLGGSPTRRENPLGRRNPRGSRSPGWPKQSARRHGHSQGAKPWRGAGSRKRRLLERRPRQQTGPQDPKQSRLLRRSQEDPPTPWGQGRPRGRTALRVEIDPEGWNPKGGTGMKQGRQVPGGGKPWEREKRWEGTYLEVGTLQEE